MDRDFAIAGIKQELVCPALILSTQGTRTRLFKRLSIGVPKRVAVSATRTATRGAATCTATREAAGSPTCTATREAAGSATCTATREAAGSPSHRTPNSVEPTTDITDCTANTAAACATRYPTTRATSRRDSSAHAWLNHASIATGRSAT